MSATSTRLPSTDTHPHLNGDTVDDGNHDDTLDLEDDSFIVYFFKDFVLVT